MIFLRHTSPTGKERHYDAFLAGLLGGYTVFGRTIHNSVSQQIVIYVFARVCLALAKLAVQQRNPGMGAHGKSAVSGFELFGDGELRRQVVRNGWPVFASVSWAMVMYIFRWHPESVQSSLRSSMSYMWVFSIAEDGEFANVSIVMYSRIIGTRCGRCFGITSELYRHGMMVRFMYMVLSLFSYKHGDLRSSEVLEYNLFLDFNTFGNMATTRPASPGALHE
jgi:hypothetical protein